VRKVATAFAVSTAWVYKMADQQQIPHVRRGSTILFPYAELVAWFNGKRSPR
jgi:excisionase family DNA binding protein